MKEVRLLLVHGSFHGAWCWDHLIPELAARDVDAFAIELPFTSLAYDAAAVASAIEEAEGPLIVVGPFLRWSGSHLGRGSERPSPWRNPPRVPRRPYDRPHSALGSQGHGWDECDSI